MTLILETEFHRNRESNGKINEELAISCYLTVLNAARELSKENKAKILEIPKRNPYYFTKYVNGIESFAYGEHRELFFTRKKEFLIESYLKAYRRFGEIEIWAYGDSFLIEKLKKSVESVEPLAKKRLEQFIKREVNTYKINGGYYNLNDMPDKNIKKLAELILTKGSRKNTKLHSKIKKLMR